MEKSSADEIRIGDTVRYKSERPRMEVVGIMGRQAVCRWLDHNGHQHESTIGLREIVRIDDADVPVQDA